LILTTSHPYEEYSLATSLSTWSPNELEYFLSVIKTIFWRHCSGAKACVHNCNFHGREIISWRHKTSFDTLQFPNLGEVAPLWVLLVFLDFQSISLCFVFVFFFCFSYLLLVLSLLFLIHK
jgi:hypothetical protein